MPHAGSRKALLLAGAALLTAAVITVAVAVPVSITRNRAANAAASQNSPEALTGSGSTATGTRADGSSSSNVTEKGVAGVDVATLLPSGTPACNGVPGLCSVPVRLVTFPGTHNSMAVNNKEVIAESQKLGFKEQLQAGVRLFDIDYAGDRYGPRFGHCFQCFCSIAPDPNDADPTKVFAVMADFLAANPRDVIVLGLSNINCGDVATARMQLIGQLAQSPLYKYLATQVITADTMLGDLVESNQRVVMLFYDQWKTATGYTVGAKQIPNQQLLRLYGETTKVDADGASALDAQVSQALYLDINTQVQQKLSSEGARIPWRVLGLFPSSCMGCRDSSQCGALACATQVNSQPYVLWQLGKITAAWLKTTGKTAVVPAFNGFQVDYIQLPANRPGVITAAQQLNAAFAWMYNMQKASAPTLGLGNCVWVLDDVAFAGGLACVGQKTVGTSSLLGTAQGTPHAESGVSQSGARHHRMLRETAGSAAGRQLLVPANKQLKVQLMSGLTVRRTVLGNAEQVQLLQLESSIDAVQVSWQ